MPFRGFAFSHMSFKSFFSRHLISRFGREILFCGFQISTMKPQNFHAAKIPLSIKYYEGSF